MDNAHAQTDEQIALLVQSGRVEPFSILVERYEAKISRYARKFLADSDDNKDMVQEIFIKAFVNIQSFDAKRKFSPWLYRIAHNELVNALRKKKRNFLPLFNLDTFLPHSFEHGKFEEEIDLKNAKKELEKCLEGLDPKYKEPLYLYYFEELSYKEIAEILQVPVSTAGIRISRAKKIAMRAIEKQGCAKIIYGK